MSGSKDLAEPDHFSMGHAAAPVMARRGQILESDQPCLVLMPALPQFRGC